MSLNPFSSLINSESINIPILISTVTVICISTYYFLRHYSSISDVISSMNSEQSQHQQQQSQSNNDVNNNPSQTINIYIQIQQERKPFTVNTSQKIKEFISTNIQPLLNNQNATLIYQGQVLNANKTFNYYSNRISNGSVLLCRVSQYNHQHNDEQESNEESNNNVYNDRKSVSIYSLLCHGMFLIVAIYLIFCYKNYKQLFTSKTLKMFQIMLVIWAIIFSDCVAKLICYKKIVY